MRRDYLTFGDLNTRDYRVWISGKGVFTPAERKYEKINVPGRNGDLLIDQKKFNNIIIPYEAFIIQEFAGNIDAFRNTILSKGGYQRLEDSFHPEEYRMAKIEHFDPDVKGIAKAGTFRLEFDCKPQRFLKSGETPIEFERSGVIYNPTLFEAKPLIRVYGNGVLGVGEETVTISENISYVDIDCEVEDAYRGAENMNGNITLSSGEFPKLLPGENGISIGTGITRVVVTPRWWII